MEEDTISTEVETTQELTPLPVKKKTTSKRKRSKKKEEVQAEELPHALEVIEEPLPEVEKEVVVDEDLYVVPAIGGRFVNNILCKNGKVIKFTNKTAAAITTKKHGGVVVEEDGLFIIKE